VEYLFFASDATLDADQPIKIAGNEAHHAKVVLRHSVGDAIQVANGAGTHCTGTIVDIDKKELVIQPDQCVKRERNSRLKCVAVGSVKKRDRFEYAVEKAVELGADQIMVFRGDHSERAKVNDKRLRSIIVSAFKQSKRFWMPEFAFYDSLKDVLTDKAWDCLIWADEELEPNPELPELMTGKNLLLVGPEGGFSARERDLMRSYDAKMISLGKLRLRTETAVAALLSLYIKH